MRLRVGAYVLFAACASAGEPAIEIDGSTTTGDANPGGARECASGQLATNISSTGEITCAAFDEIVKGSVGASCSVYLGWRDECNGCTTAPAKWGRAGATCMNGLGADNTCTTPTLGAVVPQLFGLNFDGDMDGNDKLYGSLHCAAPEPMASVAPCPAGQFITGTYGSSYTCGTLADAAVEYVRTSCSLYMGWRDDCDGCTTAPGKWGRAGDGGCQNGAGADNTCSVASLGGETVNLFGLNPDGDVDDNDKLHVGLHCTPPMPATSMSTMGCPAGQFVTATSTSGSFTCTSPAPAVAQYFAQNCEVYFGWRDGCEGCTLAPAKWGHTRVGNCTLGAGANDTCTKHSLGSTIDLFGLNPDGDVDGNDTIYVGLRCGP